MVVAPFGTAVLLIVDSGNSDRVSINIYKQGHTEFQAAGGTKWSPWIRIASLIYLTLLRASSSFSIDRWRHIRADYRLTTDTPILSQKLPYSLGWRREWAHMPNRFCYPAFDRDQRNLSATNLETWCATGPSISGLLRALASWRSPFTRDGRCIFALPRRCNLYQLPSRHGS